MEGNFDSTEKYFYAGEGKGFDKKVQALKNTSCTLTY
ncbi:hypothetical protein EJP02_512 [Escherichia phage EJP2]|nr:hypothetical protein EJP02_512 [Escherichia phage EJP2]